ncbi:lantibiotic dehydratase [Streptomyces sp. NPDC088760]|uniref:lantibiotic dehydratase n=1 Tax=Streptomyces sp. NPDC088760 TaxID=3365890 RepID=UPI003806AF1F
MRRAPSPASSTNDDPGASGDARDAVLGGTALLRLAGLPAQAWTAGGAADLFDTAARLADTAEDLAVRARALADQVGEKVVPHPSLTPADRGAVLALRRHLHSGAAPRPADCLLLGRSPAVPPELAEQARALRSEAETAETSADALRQAVAAEQQRLAEHAWHTACSSPVLRAFVDSAAPGLADDIERRLAQGEFWSSRQLRKRTAYLWRVMGRAAVKTTPRGLAGQIAAVPVTGTPGGCTWLLAPGTPLGALATVTVENVHVVRARTTPADLHTAGAEALLAPAPLLFTEPPATDDCPDDGPGRLRCYVVDPRAPGRLRQIVLRRTPMLEGVLALLADGPRPLGDLERLLPALTAPPGRPPLTTDVLRGFLQHLYTLGVLQTCRPPRQHHSGWMPADTLTTTGTPAAPGALPQPPAEAGSGAWFLDCYRRPEAGAAVPAAAVARVQRGLRIAARLAALRAADHPADPLQHLPAALQLTEQPRPLGELLTEQLAADTPLADRRYPGWRPAHDRAGGYARLLSHLDAAARSGATCVDVDDTLLDTLGAPPGEQALPRWPLDCLLRPLSPTADPGPVAVLETASAAGVLDARFADHLTALHDGYRNSAAYRAFLAAVEEHTGVRFVELLVPPLTERSANAVRRPVTTRWWTGDPDPTPYYGPPPRAHYLPLDRISLRTSGGRIIAEADGRRIIPVHHATRSPAPPYDTLVRLLLTAGHPAASCLVRLDAPEAALPHLARLPRLTAGGDLVLAPATWRIDRRLLWRPADDLPAKVRTLALLRRDAGLPRHAFARTAPGAKPVPVDLASLTAVHLIERLCARQAGTTLLVEEMLPAPDDLLLHDALHGGAAVATQLLLRLPHDQSAGRLAEAVARTLVHGSRHDVPGPPARRPAGAAHTQGVKGEVPCPAPNTPNSTH